MIAYPVFIYGTLKKGQPNEYMMDNPENGVAKFLGRGHTVDPFPLVIASKYNLPFALSKEGMGKKIYGEVYEWDNNMLSTLDRFETTSYSDPLYTRELRKIVIIEDDKKQPQNYEVQCWVYFLEHYKPELLKLPFLKNYDSAGDHGLPYKNGDDDIRPCVILT